MARVVLVQMRVDLKILFDVGWKGAELQESKDERVNHAFSFLVSSTGPHIKLLNRFSWLIPLTIFFIKTMVGPFGAP
jgi:hypothetical protein